MKNNLKRELAESNLKLLTYKGSCAPFGAVLALWHSFRGPVQVKRKKERKKKDRKKERKKSYS